MKTSTLAILLTVCALSAGAQHSLDCDHGHNRSGRLASFCEMRELTIAATSQFSVDAGVNGGVSVKGWDRAQILVRAQVQTADTSDAAAQALATQVRIDTSAGQVRALGPSTTSGDQNWSVSYEVFVPRRTDLTLKAHNGGIAIEDVTAQVNFHTTNGGVSLRRLAGDVHGSTTNGGLSIVLAGTRWDGQQMDVETTNGGVTLAVPDNYSARLETSTVNGHVKLDYPVTVHGEISQALSVDLGSGGPLVRAVTTNGGVSIKRGTI
jgi:DUF4097 and DUF4098 domain-containing protein YvlB